MIPSKVRHLDERFKNRIAWKRQENMTYRWIFAIFEIKMFKTSLSAVKRIGQRFVIRHIELESSFRSPQSLHNKSHRLKMTVLKETFFHIFLITIRFPSLFWINLGKNLFLLFWIFGVLNKSFLKNVVFKLQNSHFKPVVVLYCGSAWATRTNFPVQCAFNNNHLPKSLHSWKRCF